MGDCQAVPTHGNYRWVRQHGQAGRLREAFANQEIPIAGDPENLYAAIADLPDRFGNFAVIRRFQIVVASPVLEQIAQQIQLLHPHCLLLQKIQEGLRSARVRLLQMQVGDE